MTKNDGGPAFPTHSGRVMAPAEGMILRDWFSGKILPSWAMVLNADLCANKCYEYAEAMILERKK